MMRLLRSLLLILMTSCAYGLTDDGNQLLEIDSHSLTLLYQQRHATYQGNVTLQQGSRKLHGDQLTLQQNKEGQVDDIILTGKPARGQYRDQTGHPLTHVEAKRIIYRPTDDLLTFNGNAKINHNGNVFTGKKILYNTKTQTLTTPENQNTRNTMVIQPYNTLEQENQSHD